MITIVELTSYLNRARKLLSEDEQEAVKTMIASDPTCGALIQKTGGIRKVRFGVGGQGKSGGVRVIYYYHNDNLPVFLLTIFGKAERDNISRAERNSLAALVRQLVNTY